MNVAGCGAAFPGTRALAEGVSDSPEEFAPLCCSVTRRPESQRPCSKSSLCERLLPGGQASLVRE